MARPLKVIDERQVEQLASIQCSLDEMAAVLGCERTTLHRRFATVIKKGREQGKSSLKRAQYKSAMDGNPTLLIWLGKQYLGQRDEQYLKGDGMTPIFNITINKEHPKNRLAEFQVEKGPQVEL